MGMFKKNQNRAQVQAIWEVLDDLDFSSGSSTSGGNIWVVDSSQVGSELSNGIPYIPLTSGGNDTIEFQIVTDANAELEIKYVMSSAAADDITLRIDTIILNDDDDPSTALIAGTAFDVTPGNNVNMHTITSADSSDLSLTITEGSLAYIKITRTDSAHAGDVRILNVRLV